MAARIEERLGALYRRFGYAPYKMSRFEEYDLYLRSKDFLLSDRVITFSGPDGRLLAMKPDVTLSIIKNAPDAPGEIRKVFYRENVYRMDRDSGEFREILQTGLECVGDLGFYELAEAVLLAARSLEVIGGRAILSLSHVGLIRSAVAASGLSEAGQKQAMDCLLRKREQELRQLCRRETADEKPLLALLRARTPAELSTLPASAARRELERIVAILQTRGLGHLVRLDFSLGNDRKYYSGLVFKGYLEGIPTGVLSGGQYDRLLQSMGRKSRAIGFAVYLDQLERLAEPPVFDVDTVLLHEPDADPASVLAAVEGLPGTVLAALAPPGGRTWKRLAKLTGGEVRILEEHA